VANALITCAREDALIVWTDAKPADDAFTRRNVFAVGPHCVGLHDGVDAWLPIVRTVVEDESLASLPVDELADQLHQRLRGVASRPDDPLGVLVLGFLPTGRPGVFGIHSERDFEIKPGRFYLYGGPVPSPIMGYLIEMFRSLPSSFDDLVDQMLLAGDVCQHVLLRRLDFPAASAIASLRIGSGLTWLTDSDVLARRQRNALRLQRVRRGMMGYFAGARS
jgi:hypothetical protein